MDTFSQEADAVNTLSDPEVRDYFLTILASRELSNEDKYEKFVSFFARESRIRNQMLRYASQAQDGVDILSRVSQDLQLWNLEELILQTQASLKNAIRRLRDSQYPANGKIEHNRGGWGFEFEQSDCWATIHAVLCLHAAKSLTDLALEADLDSMLTRGMAWLAQNRWAWSAEGIPDDEMLFVYELALVAIGLHRMGQARFGDEFSRVVANGLDRLVLCQNPDGGWEKARNQTLGVPQRRTGQNSEVGATSFALRALAETRRPAHESFIRKGTHWLLSVQNDDGSWNYVDFANRYAIKSISKTGDALQALLAVRDMSSSTDQLDARIGKAMDWLQSQEKPILEHGQVGGWGWLKDDLGSFDLENTCLILETLVQVPSVSLPLVTPSAQWLIQQQYKEGEDRARDPRDIGKWEHELTARIALSLIEYYKKLNSVSSQVCPQV